MQPLTDLLRAFVPGFEATGASWMVTGGVASILYGEPRFTQDVDVVMALRPSDARADLYIAGSDDLTRRSLDRRVYVTVFGLQIPVAPPEYVILQKLRYRKAGASDRHLRDIRAMLRVLGTAVDVLALESEAHALGLTDEWHAMRLQGE